MQHLMSNMCLVAVLVIVASIAPLASAQSSDGLYGIPEQPFISFGPNTNGGDSESTLIPPHERAELSADVLQLVAGNNQFALDLYRRLADEKDVNDNLLSSPLSISAALGMTYAGARGRTAKQMADVLHYSLPDERLHPAYGKLIEDLDAEREGYVLSIANRLFGEQTFDFQQPFLDTVRESYNAPLEKVDFIGDPDASRRRVNNWVAEKTNDKILNLLPEGSVTSDTSLVLTNAIYFNGLWKHKFDEDLTHVAAFQGAEGGTAQVDMMFQQQKFRYGDFDGFKMLEMPYAGDDLSMVVMLPDESDGLASLETTLSSDLLDSSLEAMVEQDVLVYLPKFTFDASFKLGSTLRQMGMADAFSPESADFSGIGGGFSISDVLHKAFIEVNEAGTEAAAATAVTVITTNAWLPSPVAVFNADHPFFFALRDTHSGSLMFLGRVAQPGDSVIGESGATSVPEPSTAIPLVAIGVVVMHPVIRRRVLVST